MARTNVNLQSEKHAHNLNFAKLTNLDMLKKIYHTRKYMVKITPLPHYYLLRGPVNSGKEYKEIYLQKWLEIKCNTWFIYTN